MLKKYCNKKLWKKSQRRTTFKNKLELANTKYILYGWEKNSQQLHLMWNLIELPGNTYMKRCQIQTCDAQFTTSDVDLSLS